MSNHRFAVQQESSVSRPGVWDWKMQVAPLGDASLERVRSVTYGLDPVFPNPNRVICKRESGFALKMDSSVAHNETWGRFRVRVTIVIDDGTREIQDVMLDLKDEQGAPARDLLPLPASADFDTCRTYFGFLKRKGAHAFARQVLDQADKVVGDLAPHRLWIAQQRALCTYKDSSLASDTRLRKALEILESQCHLDLTTCEEPETLGLGGAVYKRLWETTRLRSNLETSLAYYERGYRFMLANPKLPGYDAGAFTGINIAHVSELLAAEMPEGVADSVRAMLLARADQVRAALTGSLPQLPNRGEWWVAATLLDVYFCLACTDPQYLPQLMSHAKSVAETDASPWELESTGSHLLRSARLQKKLRSASDADIDQLLKEVIKVAFRDVVEFCDRGGLDGKVGLALSGGGFRASLFHIGVLARMAELDQLRHVEVISCVSGGSIVGAHYYLLLRKLLQEKKDSDIEQKDYVALVEQLLDQFLEGVQKNIRMRVAASFWSNLRMIFQPSHYSRTQRLGELYEKYLYSKVQDGDEDSKRWLNEAFIVPLNQKGEPDNSFSPRVENWRRGAKVPVLVLNATTLNTGRNWQFTASYMGEPPSYGTTADATERLEAVYFTQAPEKWQRYRLGEAVAASSCVPALFTPIVIPDLFKDRIVRLVDGGVHDNQGTRALLDQDCEFVFVSDASGQMESLPNPSHAELGVALRTNSVLQARVRISQHQELQARVQVGQLRQCAFLHLRKELERDVQKAIGQDDDSAVQVGPPPVKPLTEYDVDKRVQGALAGLRTDLDSFTDQEALSLMCSGYQMANRYLANPGTRQTGNWRFLSVAQACKDAALLPQLEVGSKLAFKIWHLNPVLNFLRILLLAALGAGVLGGLLYLWCKQVKYPLTLDLGSVAKTLLIFLAGIVLAAVMPVGKRLFGHLKSALNPGSVFSRVVVGLVMAGGGFLLCRLHLWTFDKLFLKLGRVRSDTPHASKRL